MCHICFDDKLDMGVLCQHKITQKHVDSGINPLGFDGVTIKLNTKHMWMVALTLAVCDHRERQSMPETFLADSTSGGGEAVL